MSVSKTWSGSSLEAAVGIVQTQHSVHATMSSEELAMEAEMQVALMDVG